MNTPLQLSLLETPPPRCSAPVWATLDDEHRALAVAKLARLMTRVIVAKRKTTVAVDKESNHE